MNSKYQDNVYRKHLLSNDISEIIFTTLRVPILAVEKTKFDISEHIPGLLLSVDLHHRWSPNRRAEYCAGRFLCQILLGRIGIVGHNIKSGRFREPIWPTGIVGSISHSDDYVACIVIDDSEHKGIGIDVEKLIDDEQRVAIERVVLIEEERSLVEGMGSDINLNLLTTIIFSAKESFFKSVFYRIYRYINFDVLILESINLATRTLIFKINCDNLILVLERRHITATYTLLDNDNVLTLVTS